jgi:hypothetical protein
MMAMNAVNCTSREDPNARVISITIQEQLPLMNGLGGCEAEIQITPAQASRFARLIIELVGQESPVPPAHKTRPLPSTS